VIRGRFATSSHALDVAGVERHDGADDMTRLDPIPLDLARWGLSSVDAHNTVHLGRRCLAFEERGSPPTITGLQLTDGVIEADITVPTVRSFHGLAWRVAGNDYESFFVRPHQVASPDSIQYTPVSHGISSWQLYHGPGFWAPITFPLEAWFTIRVAFAGQRADIFVADLTTPALVVRRLRRPIGPGAVGLLVGGEGLRVSRFAVSGGPVPLVEVAPDDDPPLPGVISSWDVSDPFPESDIVGRERLEGDFVARRRWTTLAADHAGLADLAFVNGIREGRDTVLARAMIRAQAAQTRPLALGFSDRAIVFVNGRRIFRGDDTYRSRDYRFLGSIGYWYAIDLSLEPGDNELIVAVSETFGGWGIQARFADVESRARRD
jgi:hypothetical protein